MPRAKPPPLPSASADPLDPAAALTDAISTIRSLKKKLLTRFQKLPPAAPVADAIRLSDGIANLLNLEGKFLGLHAPKKIDVTARPDPAELVEQLLQRGLPVPPEPPEPPELMPGWSPDAPPPRHNAGK